MNVRSIQSFLVLKGTGGLANREREFSDLIEQTKRQPPSAPVSCAGGPACALQEGRMWSVVAVLHVALFLFRK